MCAVLEISERTYYKYRKTEEKDYYDYLIIKEIFEDSKGTYGYRRITEGIKIKYGVIFNHKKVRRIMAKYYLKPEYIKRIRPNTYKRIEANVRPNLIKRKFHTYLPKYSCFKLILSQLSNKLLTIYNPRPLFLPLVE